MLTKADFLLFCLLSTQCNAEKKIWVKFLWQQKIKFPRKKVIKKISCEESLWKEDKKELLLRTYNKAYHSVKKQTRLEKLGTNWMYSGDLNNGLVRYSNGWGQCWGGQCHSTLDGDMKN